MYTYIYINLRAVAILTVGHTNFAVSIVVTMELHRSKINT